jgi:hypothetical protein
VVSETADATPGTARARTSPPAKKAAPAKVEADAKAETPKAPAKPESKDEGSKG